MRRLWIALAGLFAFFSCSIMAQDVRDFDKEEAAITRGDYDSAIHDLTEAIDSGKLSDHEKMIAYGDRSTAYLQKGAYQQVISDASVSIRLGPNLPYGYVNRGISYCMLGQNDLGIADFNVALRLSSNDSSAYYGRGTCYVHKEEYKKAIKDFDSALRLDQNHGPSLNNRGTSFMSLGLYKQALADFSAAVKLTPGDADARFNKAMAEMHLDQYDRALADFDEAIRIDPGLAEAYLWRGAMLASHEQYDNALRDFDEVIRLKPQASHIYSKAYLARGRIYLIRHKLHLAIADFSAALEQNPSADLALFYRCMAYFDQGDSQRALADSDALARMLGDSAPYFVFYERGALRFLAGHFEEANSDFEEAIRRDPQDRDSYVLLYVSLAKTPKADVASLKTRLAKLKLKLDKWPDPILAMYQGKVTTDQVGALALKGTDALERNKRQCQAPFYIGEYELQRGHEQAAIRLLTQAVDACSGDTIEARFAASELEHFKKGK